MLNWILFAALALFLPGCNKSKMSDLQTVSTVDLNKYKGSWYEIARLPNSFQRGCVDSKAEYTLQDGKVKVKNTCLIKEKMQMSEGSAYATDASNSKLKVTFFWPFYGDYWIIDLDAESYSYAVVASPDKKYLWILSRTPAMNHALYISLVEKCKNLGFDVNQLIKN